MRESGAFKIIFRFMDKSRSSVKAWYPTKPKVIIIQPNNIRVQKWKALSP